jgi:hypothetical protein
MRTKLTRTHRQRHRDCGDLSWWPPLCGVASSVWRRYSAECSAFLPEKRTNFPKTLITRHRLNQLNLERMDTVKDIRQTRRQNHGMNRSGGVAAFRHGESSAATWLCLPFCVRGQRTGAMEFLAADEPLDEDSPIQPAIAFAVGAATVAVVWAVPMERKA